MLLIYLCFWKSWIQKSLVLYTLLVLVLSFQSFRSYKMLRFQRLTTLCSDGNTEVSTLFRTETFDLPAWRRRQYTKCATLGVTFYTKVAFRPCGIILFFIILILWNIVKWLKIHNPVSCGKNCSPTSGLVNIYIQNALTRNTKYLMPNTKTRIASVLLLWMLCRQRLAT